MTLDSCTDAINRVSTLDSCTDAINRVSTLTLVQTRLMASLLLTNN
ncbi:MAG: hypothetical protein KME40_06195 [Komarekiella atlantica HA4396-MV6]|nr:hypothetical protein [Komarekiella atlantica HA4396-MV6]